MTQIKPIGMWGLDKFDNMFKDQSVKKFQPLKAPLSV